MNVTGTRSLTADDVIEVAGRVVDVHGADALTMRRLADELGVAVTSIYWHVGNRDELVDALVERLITDMGTLRARGGSPRERITSLARGRETRSSGPSIQLRHHPDAAPRSRHATVPG